MTCYEGIPTFDSCIRRMGYTQCVSLTSLLFDIGECRERNVTIFLIEADVSEHE